MLWYQQWQIKICLIFQMLTFPKSMQFIAAFYMKIKMQFIIIGIDVYEMFSGQIRVTWMSIILYDLYDSDLWFIMIWHTFSMISSINKRKVNTRIRSIHIIGCAWTRFENSIKYFSLDKAQYNKDDKLLIELNWYQNVPKEATWIGYTFLN